MSRRAFPLPPGLAARGAAPIAPRVWGCSCGQALTRISCCQRAACWSFDDRGRRDGWDEEMGHDWRIEAPADVPADHCARCCPHTAALAAAFDSPTPAAPGRKAA